MGVDYMPRSGGSIPDKHINLEKAQFFHCRNADAGPGTREPGRARNRERAGSGLPLAVHKRTSICIPVIADQEKFKLEN
ncbi:hypothetical protein GCM10010439_01640 [Actinocorallia aurantiaca]|uniref:Uncharacterized protein n=1 Tax=Actinocorallia aurantiaca TaxID=46204 RepID=A0ABN3TTT2_9ACTN